MRMNPFPRPDSLMVGSAYLRASVEFCLNTLGAPNCSLRALSGLWGVRHNSSCALLSERERERERERGGGGDRDRQTDRDREKQRGRRRKRRPKSQFNLCLAFSRV